MSARDSAADSLRLYAGTRRSLRLERLVLAELGAALTPKRKRSGR